MTNISCNTQAASIKKYEEKTSHIRIEINHARGKTIRQKWPARGKTMIKCRVRALYRTQNQGENRKVGNNCNVHK